MQTEKFDVKGMHCASCSHLIKTRISKLPGVENCDVNYATEKANVIFDPKKVNIGMMNDEIGKLGYTFREHHNHTDESTTHVMPDGTVMSGMDHSAHLGLNQTKEEKLKELESEKNKVTFVLPIALLTFIIMIWDITSQTVNFIPEFPLSMNIFNAITFIFATVVMFWIGKPYIDGALRFFRYGAANMDTLIGIGTMTAYVYSAVLFLFPQIRGLLQAPEFVYFDVVIIVIGFVKLGKYLEVRSKMRTGEAIEKLLNLQAKTALVIRDDKEIEVPLEEVHVGDIVIVKPGAKVPVDGVIIDGSSSIDESMISGEPFPVDKKISDTVVGATINKQGHFKFRATKVGSETMLAQIIKMVEDAQGSRAPIQGLADKVSSIFVPVVLGIAIVTFVAWLTIGSVYFPFSMAFSYGLITFVGILVIACPCALGLATPTAIIVGVGKGAENGILIKDAEALEVLREVNTIVMDKTGTITMGKPQVTDIILLDNSIQEDELLRIVASIEKLSEHPLAQAVVKEAEKRSLSFSHVSSFKAIEGVGVQGKIKDDHILIQKPSKKEHNEELERLQSQGKTVVEVELNGKLVGLLAISDSLKDEAVKSIKDLHAMGITVVMLTGDNKNAAKYIASQAGIDTVIAEVFPQDKANKIKELQNEGKKVAMAGDGINDAPALTQANVGIAMATGTDIAVESADIVILHGDVRKITQAVKLSRSTVRTIKQNLFWAFVYNIIGIPVAAGILYPFTGLLLNPIFAGMAMAFSSVSVVGNSLLLKRVKL